MDIRSAVQLLGFVMLLRGNNVYVLVTDKSMRLPMDPIRLVNTSMQVAASGLVRVDGSMMAKTLKTLMGATEDENDEENVRQFTVKGGSKIYVHLRDDGIVSKFGAMPNPEGMDMFLSTVF